MPQPHSTRNAKPMADALASMASRGGRWAAYQNVEIGHRELGHLKFLQVGPENTFKEPPPRLPDTRTEINWRYWFIGYVDLQTGKIEKEER